MSADRKRSFLRGWRTWLGVAALACVLSAVYAMLPYLGIGSGITDANGERIAAGMTRSEVEAVLGAPNLLPNLARKGEAFWDNNAVLGFRYVAIHVVYDAEGRVVHTRVSGFWRSPTWKFW
jgi:hypothetical protein